MRLPAVLSAICSKAAMATLVVLGLLMIPVECSVAMGPHTIFVSADAVAALQGKGRQPHGGHDAPAAPERADMTTAAIQPAPTALPEHGASPMQPVEATRDAADHVPADAPAPDDAAASPRGINYPARPAGISADAVVALDIPGGQPDLLGMVDDDHVRSAVTMPPDRLLTGPEPPPP